MVISGEVFYHIDRHGYVYPLCIVVPIELDAAVQITCPIFNNLIQLSMQCLKEVFEMFVADVFDAEVINAQIESNGMRDVLP